MGITIPQRGVIVPKIAPITQRYYGPIASYGGTLTTATVTLNTLYAVPFYVPAAFVADQIAVNITTAGAGGGKLRIGVYTATAAGLPDALLVDSGELAADVGAPTIVTATISLSLEAGRNYYMAIVSGVSPVVTGISTPNRPLGAATAASAVAGGYSRSFTYAALPAAWGTPSAFIGIVPSVVVRAT